MTDHNPKPTELKDEDLELSGGWLFEGCYKHSVKQTAKEVLSPKGAPEHDVRKITTAPSVRSIKG